MKRFDYNYIKREGVIGWAVDTSFNFDFYLQPLKLPIMVYVRKIKMAANPLFNKEIFL